MKILKESKETLPIAFLTDFISKGWEEVGYLKADIEAIREAYKGTKPIEELIQNLIDAYLVCIGQLEFHLHDNKYLKYPEESGLLKEDLEVKTTEEVIEIKPSEEIKDCVVNQEENKVTVVVASEESPEEAEKEVEKFEYFVDFDEPDMSQPKLTDADLYN